jgi:hypothetical protein
MSFTTARQAHSLSKEEAERAYPVRLQGVITYFDRYRDPDKAFLFLNDGSGSIYVTLPKEWKLPLHPGQLVTVEGVTGPGHFAPIVDSTRILILRESSLPRAAPLISVAAMLTGSEDGKWLESRGVVRFVARDKGGLQLNLQTNAGLIRARRPRCIDWGLTCRSTGVLSFPLICPVPIARSACSGHACRTSPSKPLESFFASPVRTSSPRKKCRVPDAL